MYVLANPQTFMRLSGRVLPWLAGASLVLLAVGLVLAFRSPADYQQGETVKIMYIHVPAAWTASFAYVVMTASALGTLVWRHPLAEAAQKAAAPLGAGFTFVCLITGSLWGKPMWGTYWVWDARLTSMLVLFLTYVGLLALWHTIEEPGRRDPDARRGHRSADRQVLGRLVEHASPGFDLHPSGLDRRRLHAGAVADHGAVLHADLRDAARDVDPQRGAPPPPPPPDARGGGRPCADRDAHARRGPVMMAVPHIGFIVAAYAVTTLVLVGGAAAILLDGRALRRELARMERRTGRRRMP